MFRSSCRARAFVAVLAFLGASPPAEAGIRTRLLPPVPDRVEPALVARAAAANASRIHCLVEIEPGVHARAFRDGDVRLLRPAGGRRWLASLPVAAVRARALASGVVVAWDLGPLDRCAPGFVAPFAAVPGDATIALRIKVFGDASLDDVIDAVGAAGGRVTLVARTLGFTDVIVPRSFLGAALARDDVRWIEAAPDAPVLANDNMRIDADVNSVQAIGLDGAGVLIGMWDGGRPDTTHPDLAGRITIGESGLTAQPHPTHVAGTLLGNGANSENQGGTSLQWRGVATAAQAVCYEPFDAVLEVEDAVLVHDVDLTTNSWVYPVSEANGNCALYGDYASDAPEFDAIVTGAYGKKIPVVFAAGNERDDGDCGIAAGGGYRCIPPPGTAKNVITVGAHHSDVMHMTPFSSWGPTDDGRMKPDISAPGCQQAGDFTITSTIGSGFYGPNCGTSMATPVVSGSVAILIEQWRAMFPGEPRPATSKALLGGFAKDRALVGPDYRFGLGAISLSKSVTELQTATTIEDAVEDLGLDTWNFFVPASAGTLTVTIAWDDPAAAELADTTLVNDLDLELVGPTSGTHLPFVLDPANPDTPATVGQNRLDNVEQVRVIAPESGSWTARVIGFRVPDGPQEYSLVGFDTRPPADVVALTATPTSSVTIELTWISPGDADRAGTLLVRSAAPITWTPSSGAMYALGSTPAPGVTVILADDVDHSSSPHVDEPLSPGTTYFYAAFAYDEVPSYSPGASTSAETSGVVDAATLPRPAVEVRFSTVSANPFASGVTFAFELPAPAIVSLSIYDAAGRRVAPLIHGARAAGAHRVAWDGRDASGQSVGAGVYFARFRSGTRSFTQKIVRLP